jgi:magnesium chelatase family protein
VIAARERQQARLGPGRCNAEASPAELRETGRVEPAAREVLARGYDRLRMSGRGYDRALRLARTVADMEGSDAVTGDHVAEALMLRRRPSGGFNR